jgi:hypothetical protein
MSSKLPAFQFYPADWQRDSISGCSLAAQGLWLRMMFLMHFSERYGYLCINGSPMHPAHIAHRCGTPQDQYETLLAELDLAGVPSRLPDGTIYSRRMVRDAKSREIFRKFGKKGGNPALNPPLNPPLKAVLKKKGEIEDSSEGKGTGEGEHPRVKSIKTLRKIMECKS